MAYTVLGDAGMEDTFVTWRQLDLRVRAVAAVLEEQGLAGQRALLVYPPGLDYVVAFLAFGFLVLLGYAGARAQLAAEGSLRRRLVDLERKLALLRRNGGSRPAAAASASASGAPAPEAPVPEALAKLTKRLEAMERRLAGLAGDGSAAPLGLPAKAATRPRHRQSPQRGAGS